MVMNLTRLPCSGLINDFNIFYRIEMLLFLYCSKLAQPLLTQEVALYIYKSPIDPKFLYPSKSAPFCPLSHQLATAVIKERFLCPYSYKRQSSLKKTPKLSTYGSEDGIWRVRVLGWVYNCEETHSSLTQLYTTVKQ